MENFARIQGTQACSPLSIQHRETFMLLFHGNIGKDIHPTVICSKKGSPGCHNQGNRRIKTVIHICWSTIVIFRVNESHIYVNIRDLKNIFSVKNSKKHKPAIYTK